MFPVTLSSDESLGFKSSNSNMTNELTLKLKTFQRVAIIMGYPKLLYLLHVVVAVRTVSMLGIRKPPFYLLWKGFKYVLVHTHTIL